MSYLYQLQSELLLQMEYIIAFTKGPTSNRFYQLQKKSLLQVAKQIAFTESHIELLTKRKPNMINLNRMRIVFPECKTKWLSQNTHKTLLQVTKLIT